MAERCAILPSPQIGERLMRFPAYVHRLFHSVCYYIIWFVGLYSAAHLHSIMGLFVTLLIFFLQVFWQYRIAQDTRDLIRLIIILTFCGAFFDSMMVWLNIFIYQDNIFYPYLCPPWMIMQWLEFAIIVHALLESLWPRPILAAFCCLLGFPLAYLGGASLGAVTFVHGNWSVILVGLIWMWLLPAIMYQHYQKVLRC